MTHASPKKDERARRAAGFAIVADTREQVRHSSQYTFAFSAEGTPAVPVIRAKLDVGDYSVYGLEDRFALERKTVADAYHTFGSGRERFERELERAAKLEYFGIVIEGSLRGLTVPPRFVETVTPGTIINSLIAWSIDYPIRVWLADDRHHAEFLTYSIARKFYNRAVERGIVEVPALPFAP